MTVEPQGVSHRNVAVRGVDLHLAEAGEGAPLLLLHGWPQHWLTWRKLIPELAPDWHVLAPDLRGFGASEAPTGDYRKHALAADVLALLDAEGIERVAIVGHDWGGWIAYLLALEHPERVERFAALDIPAPWAENRSPARIAGFAAFASYQYLLATPVLGERVLRRSPAFVRAFIRRGSRRSHELTDEELDVFAVSLQEPARARASSALYRRFLTRELPAMLANRYTSRDLRVPGLSIMGERSLVSRLVGIPKPRPNLRVEVIPAAGHFLPDEAPEEVLDLLRPFLEEPTLP